MVTPASQSRGFSPATGVSATGSSFTAQPIPLKRPDSRASARVTATGSAGSSVTALSPACTCTRRSGAAYGNGRNSTRSNSENTTAFAPIPIAAVSTAATANPLARVNDRTSRTTLRQRADMVCWDTLLQARRAKTKARSSEKFEL